MPEGDSLHRAACRLQPLVGQRLEVEAPHPRAASTRIAERLDGRRLESVEAVGKNVVLRFEGGLVLRSHLRMSGRWSLRPRGETRAGRPWLVLRGETEEGVLWNGPVLELHTRALARLGPDILAPALELDALLARVRAEPRSRALGDLLLDQRVVAGIGNMWMAEALWRARVSPWLPLGEAGDAELRETLAAARELMHGGLEGRRSRHEAYRRAGRPCRRCGTRIRSRGQGDGNRTAYWCPGCQRGEGPPSA